LILKNGKIVRINENISLKNKVPWYRILDYYIYFQMFNLRQIIFKPKSKEEFLNYNLDLLLNLLPRIFKIFCYLDKLFSE
ncbi:MAG: hypothetical protein KC414_15025, partial [Romboutsia sp.]|nr:hypothetical protein [Romboutsia sp.]